MAEVSFLLGQRLRGTLPLERGWDGAVDILEVLVLTWTLIVPDSLFKSWEVLPGSNFTFLLWQKLLLSLIFAGVSVTLTALTARVRGEAEQVLKKKNQFHSVLVS